MKIWIECRNNSIYSEMDANDLDQICGLMGTSPSEIKTAVDLLNSGLSLIDTEAGVSSSYEGIINALQSINTSPEEIKTEENSDYRPNQPLNGSKYLCSICGDRASGKHYGVHSCEGCKGFFKRTVRKDLTYACRENKECIIDKRQRNRCQYCRYQRCLSCGMKREAVQDERQKRTKNLKSVETTSRTFADPIILEILEAENKSDRQSDINSIPYLRMESDLSLQTEYKFHILNLCKAINSQLYQILEYSLRINFFAELHKDDQVMLLKSCWNELLIVGIAWRSIEFLSVAEVVDKRTKYNKPLKISISPNLTIHRSIVEKAKLEILFDRILLEVSAKMKRLNIDKVEVSCLKAIILFNSDIRGLRNSTAVGMAREHIYQSLNTYCLAQHPGDEGRFAKLLLHLPTIRSISIKCVEHLHFFRLIGEKQLNDLFAEMIEPIRSLI